MAERPHPPFELLLFHRTLADTVSLLNAGADAAIIDFETRGKQARQSGYDTEINAHTLDDLYKLRAVTDKPILCRISSPDADAAEVDAAIRSGADELIIPMVRTAADVARVRALAAGRCRLCIMIETAQAANDAAHLGIAPGDRVYVGLTDLQIERGTSSIFAPLADGLLPLVRDRCGPVPFGFGGLTLPGYGAPVPTQHLMGEMARLACGFTFLRRSFYRDIKGKDPRMALLELRGAIATAQLRSVAAVEADHTAMLDAVQRAQEQRRGRAHA